MNTVTLLTNGWILPQFSGKNAVDQLRMLNGLMDRGNNSVERVGNVLEV